MKTSWGTAENYRRVFERHVLPKLERYFDYYDTPGDEDCIEICTSLIHNFLLTRRVDALVKVFHDDLRTWLRRVACAWER
jgi:hypothetical protein